MMIASRMACAARWPRRPAGWAPLQHAPLARATARAFEALLRFTDRARPRTRLGAGPRRINSSDAPELGLEEAGGCVATVSTGVGGGKPPSTRSSADMPRRARRTSEAARRILACRNTPRPSRSRRSPTLALLDERPATNDERGPDQSGKPYSFEIGRSRGYPRSLLHSPSSRKRGIRRGVGDREVAAEPLGQRHGLPCTTRARSGSARIHRRRLKRPRRNERVDPAEAIRLLRTHRRR